MVYEKKYVKYVIYYAAKKTKKIRMRNTHVVLVYKNKPRLTRVFEEHFTSEYKWAIPRYGWMRDGIRIAPAKYFKKKYFALKNKKHRVDCKNLVDRLLLYLMDAMTDDMINHNNKLIFYSYSREKNIINRCSWSIKKHNRRHLDIKPTIILEGGNIRKSVYLEVKKSTKEEILKNYYKGIRYEDTNIS